MCLVVLRTTVLCRAKAQDVWECQAQKVCPACEDSHDGLDSVLHPEQLEEAGLCAVFVGLFQCVQDTLHNVPHRQHRGVGRTGVVQPRRVPFHIRLARGRRPRRLSAAPTADVNAATVTGASGSRAIVPGGLSICHVQIVVKVHVSTVLRTEKRRRCCRL